LDQLGGEPRRIHLILDTPDFSYRVRIDVVARQVLFREDGRSRRLEGGRAELIDRIAEVAARPHCSRPQIELISEHYIDLDVWCFEGDVALVVLVQLDLPYSVLDRGHQQVLGVAEEPRLVGSELIPHQDGSVMRIRLLEPPPRQVLIWIENILRIGDFGWMCLVYRVGELVALPQDRLARAELVLQVGLKTTKQRVYYIIH
jgi:hypothetical protein